MLNAILATEEVVALYDLTDILSVMISCTATFVAIIGGLIANKAISATSEKEAIDRQLQQIDAEITVNNEHIDSLSKWLLESDAEDFIDDNIDRLFEDAELIDVYDADDDVRVTYEELLPYWNKARTAIKLFEQVNSSETDVLKNSDGIPKSILTDLDDFQRRICTNYSGRIEYGKTPYPYVMSGYSKAATLHAVEYYEKTSDERQEYITNNAVLIAKENLLYERQDAISISKDVKGGMKIFAIVSFANIILPIIFMLFNPTSNIVWYCIETSIAFVTFSAGILIMIKYIYSLFPKKKTDIGEMGARK